MPPYKSSDSHKRKKNYSRSAYIQAIACVRNGSSYRKASKIYGVPIGTLYGAVSGKYNEGKYRPGPICYLTETQEKRLLNFLLYSTEIGNYISRIQIPYVVKSMLDSDELNTEHEERNSKFKDNIPSQGWVYRFLERYPQLASKKQKKLSLRRTIVTDGTILEWFVDLEKFLIEQHNISREEFFTESNSNRIFKFTEIRFPLCEDNFKLQMLTTKGVEYAYENDHIFKKQITVLSSTAAGGSISTPLVIFPDVLPELGSSIKRNEFNLGTTENGCISVAMFSDWFANCFLTSLGSEVKFPILVIIDGRTSYMVNIATFELCLQNNVILYCVPPNAYSIIHCFNTTVYGPLKKLWNSKLCLSNKTYDGHDMTRDHFLPVFHSVWQKTRENHEKVKAGFMKCGLSPFNPEALHSSYRIGNLKKENLCKLPVNLKKRINSLKKRNCESDYEIAGMMKIYEVIEKTLTNEMAILFESRLKEGYNQINHTDGGILWQIYVQARRLIGFEDTHLSTHMHSDFTANEMTESYNKKNENEYCDISDNYTDESISKNKWTDLNQSTKTLHEVSNTLVERKERAEIQSSNSIYLSVNKYPVLKKVFDVPMVLINDWEYPLYDVKNVSGMDNNCGQIYTFSSASEFEQDRINEEQCKVEGNCLSAYELLQGEHFDKTVVKSEKKSDESESDCDVSIKIENSDESHQLNDCCRNCLKNDDWEYDKTWIDCSNPLCDTWYHKKCVSHEICQMSEKFIHTLNFFCDECENV